MINPVRSFRFRNYRQRGGAAVEAALVLPILVLFLAFPIFYARCCWHYTVAQKAAQDAVRYLSAVSATEMKSKPLALEAGQRAIDIATREMAELSPGSPINPPTAFCDDTNCGFNTTGVTPSQVRIFISFDMIGALPDLGYDQIIVPITASASMNYVGN